MARRVSEATRQAAALMAGRRMVARGERPGYRLTAARVGSWTIDALPWLSVAAPGRHAALEEARAAIAAWLDVSPEAFDLDV